MSIVSQIGPDTIVRLERAAVRRLSEAAWLADGKHYLASIYLCGYAAEMTIGAAYLRLLGYGSTQPISSRRLASVLDGARVYTRLDDKSHPLDGLARLLVAQKPILSPPAYSKPFERRIIDAVDQICQHWRPKLRYRAIVATPEQEGAVREAAAWIVDHSHRY